MMHSDHPRSSSRLRHARLALLVSAFTTAGSSLPIMAMAADDDSWQFNGGPYLWGAGIRGHVGHRSTGTQFIKSDFSDIARTVDMSVMLMGEARRGPYSVLADLMYIDTDTRNRLPAGAPASKLEVESKTASGFLGADIPCWGMTIIGWTSRAACASGTAAPPSPCMVDLLAACPGPTRLPGRTPWWGCVGTMP